jgi:hypothetical protein
LQLTGSFYKYNLQSGKNQLQWEMLQVVRLLVVNNVLQANFRHSVEVVVDHIVAQVPVGDS